MNDPLMHALRVVRGIQAVTTTTGSSARPRKAPPGVKIACPVTEAAAGAIGEPATAFVSWAHSHASWSSERTRDWESQVAAFAALLRRLGIQADVDLFHLDEPMDWTRYGPQQVERGRYTLIVMSKAWAERWSGTNAPREGAGAAAEADTLKGLFSRNQEEWQRRVVIVMFPEVGSDVVPPDLQRVSRVSVNPADPDSYEQLVRLITEQPRYPQPPIGEVPIFGAAVGYEDSSALVSLRDRLAAIEKRKKQLAKQTSQGAQTERERLGLSEAATRGFIDAELTMED